METWGLYEGDITVDMDGVIRVKKQMECLADRINTALATVRGELDDYSAGVDYYGIIFAKTPISLKIVEFTRVISAIEGVKDVEFISCKTNPQTGVWTFEFNVSSVYGDLTIQKDVANTANL